MPYSYIPYMLFILVTDIFLSLVHNHSYFDAITLIILSVVFTVHSLFTASTYWKSNLSLLIFYLQVILFFIHTNLLCIHLFKYYFHEIKINILVNLFKLLFINILTSST